MALKAKKPEEVNKRLKLLLYGPAGCGKTTAAITFPQSYIIDCERGTDHYADLIHKATGVVLHSTDDAEIAAEIVSLLTEEHDYRTLIIDPVTMIYQSIQEKWNRRFEEDAHGRGKSQQEIDMADWGPRFWGKVKSDMKRVESRLRRIDMNVIVTSHQKDIYGDGMKRLGVAPDAIKGADYLFDTVIRMERTKGGKRIAYTEKDRTHKFPDTFEFSYTTILELYGKDTIEKKADKITLATIEQVQSIRNLLEIVKVTPETIEKWMDKANAEKFEEFTNEQAEGVLKYLKDKMTGKAKE